MILDLLRQLGGQQTGTGGGSPLQNLSSDPNFLQMLGSVGQKFGQGASAGEALNPMDMIRQIQNQKAMADLMAAIKGQGQGQGQGLEGQQAGAEGLQQIPQAGAPTMSGLDALRFTPQDQPGPTSFSFSRDAKGDHTRFDESPPPVKGMGEQLPPEAIAKPPQRGGAGQGSFFRALLG